ncbi:MAG TPA: hypothetical protein VGQ64_07915 [Candidatus Limnocylindrales bacterium]|jgi:hypothetical protein|nr:hypothetical protein [Candidatus Limnocylindrales bacterium]
MSDDEFTRDVAGFEPDEGEVLERDAAGKPTRVVFRKRAAAPIAKAARPPAAPREQPMTPTEFNLAVAAAAAEKVDELLGARIERLEKALAARGQGQPGVDRASLVKAVAADVYETLEREDRRATERAWTSINKNRGSANHTGIVALPGHIDRGGGREGHLTIDFGGGQVEAVSPGRDPLAKAERRVSFEDVVFAKPSTITDW